MHRFWAAAVVAAFGFGGMSAKAEPAVVVELYTSQGCSSCPPADKLLTELTERQDVIPLALHVDYWDYIGWKDIYADHAYTIRQKSYARAAGHRTIYTPQMIVGGRDHVVGYKPMKLAELIEAHGDLPPRVALEAVRESGRVTIEAEALGAPLPPEMVVQLVRYRPEDTVTIRRGENAGHTFTYSNIVTEWKMLGGWDGSGPLRMQADLSGDEPAVVILQATGHREILAATRVK